jgi:hypothetical protein|tara:strand:+ start:2065 stop:2793 length:729 start_codon:yes stop_codon:yes gene_type:complete
MNLPLSPPAPPIKVAKNPIDRVVRGLVLWLAVILFRLLPERRLPGKRLLSLFRYGWGNVTYSAGTSYLEYSVKLFSRKEGEVLECGSGLTTVVLGLLAEKTGREIHSLEHDSSWWKLVRRRLSSLKIKSVKLHLYPLADRGSYHWYDWVATDLPDSFKLILCDGPPGETLGGRRGLLYEMNNRLAEGSIIMVDDAERSDEMEMLNEWLQSREFIISLQQETDLDKQFAILTLGKFKAVPLGQ